jgi:hypothetical protein
LEFRFVFLEDAFVVVFPELLRGVLTGDPSEDLLAAYDAALVTGFSGRGIDWRVSAYLGAHLGIGLGRRRRRRW